jgi:transcriptional regulator with XRE-family HTH domain
MKQLNASQLARQVGITPAMMSAILRRERRPSPEVAAALEEATGVDRRAWLYPSEFENPFLKIEAQSDQAANG